MCENQSDWLSAFEPDSQLRSARNTMLDINTMEETMQKAYSLMELAMVMAINVLIATFSIPILIHPVRDSHFDNFACELTSHLVSARRLAQITGRSVWFSVKRAPEERYRISMDSRDGVIEAKSVFGSGYSSDIVNELPGFDLPHPTSGQPIVQAFSSTHSNGIVFKDRGSSTGTVVFYDRGSRVLSVVFSGQTGRFRVFLWNESTASWSVFF
ncbi:MAG: hypothetical protein CSA81_05045 [Acidobacteria bacterium]|nr:MAG: hypothetical protein CSA81_05045 [Acidobacteriota bacterium]PIE91044.1 MAG: hypothetical protein CR997_02690 [Acidobacteriota bacterium]